MSAWGITPAEIAPKVEEPFPVPGLLDDINCLRRMDGRLFTAYEHCGSTGDRPDELWNFRKCLPRDPWRYVGWCPSGATSKPESGWPGVDDHLAVMLENPEGERSWLHVPVNGAIKYETDRLINGIVRSCKR